MKLSFVCPSFIGNEYRLNFAKKSLTSLNSTINENKKLIVINDKPKLKIPLINIADKTSVLAENLYKNKENTNFISRFGKGSAKATLDGVRLAKEQNIDLIYIHIDDNIYLPIFNELLEHSINAFEKNNDLKIVKLSGRPILSHNCNESLGNKTNINILDNKITFNNISLTPKKEIDYTLWSTNLTKHMVDDYWPITFWNALYEISFLEKILSVYKKISKKCSLADIEIYYNNKKNWKNLINEYKNSKLGFINMQFGMFETERNKEWEKIINYPNNKIN